MQNYRIDFTMNRGHEMTIDRAAGIYRHELDDIELNMLHTQRVPYLLPIDWFELDGKVTFRYMLTGLKMLVHRLQQQPLTMEQYYVLLLGVTDALNECKHYMLRPEGCLLDEQFIFIGEQLHDIRLAYVPMKGNEEGQSIGSGDLLSLIVRFTSYVGQIHGEGLKRILQHVNGNKWPLAELRSTLLDLIGGQPEQQHAMDQTKLQQPSHNNQFHHIHEPSLKDPKPQLASPEQQQSKLSPLSAATVDSTFSPERTPYLDRIANRIRAEELPYEDEDEQEQDGREAKRKWIFTAGLAVAIACVWRFIHLAALTRQSMLISAGITLLLLAAILLVWRNKAGQMAYTVESQFELEEFLPDSAPFAKLDTWNSERNSGDFIPINTSNSSSSSASLHSSTSSSPSTSVTPFNSINVMNVNQSVPPLIEPTVLLSRQQHEEPSKPSIWLQRCWEGQQSKIELAESSFKIGRAGEQVGYAESAGGVSRIHLEIEHINGEYKAKDLGSRNGSLLNGQAMVPYKSYTLEAGDVIHLAGVLGPAYELKAGTG